MSFFTIAVKLQLVMPKVNKKTKGRSEKFTRQLHFLKNCCNICDAFGAILYHFT